MSNLARPVATLLLVLAAAAAAAPARADAAAPAVYVETDPATFALGGWSGHVRAALPGHRAWTVGVGAYALDLPRLLIDLDAANRDAGWGVRIRVGYGGFVDRFVRRAGRGPFVGVQLAAQHLAVTRAGGAARATALLAMPRAGYHWRPSAAVGLYLTAWVGLGARAVVAGDTAVGAARYHVAALVPYAALHVGWSF
ncbi:MAG: hypothetical protein JNK64_08930 [Myxococcales bacterium]|nr:hypothetical protein [Myxococcales bacterium]